MVSRQNAELRSESRLSLLLRLLHAVYKPNAELILENLALRQQVAALMLGKYRPKLHDADRAFWVALQKTWPRWTGSLLVVKPETAGRLVDF